MSIAECKIKTRGCGGGVHQASKLGHNSIKKKNKITDGIIWPPFVKPIQMNRKILGSVTHIVIKKRGDRRLEGKQPHMTN